MINNNMLYGIGDLLIGNAVTIPSYMTLGSVSGTLSSGDIITSGEFDRNALIITSRSGNIVQFETIFPGATASSLAINSVGLFNSSAGGALWANMLMSSILQTTSFDIDVGIWVQISGV